MSPTPATAGPTLKSVRATIDLAAVRKNFRMLSEKAGKADCAAVVKGDGYGLGMRPVAECCWSAGARTFFVARVEDGIDLRTALHQARIATLDGLGGVAAQDFETHRLSPVLGRLDEIHHWFSSPRTVDAFIHIDTGMNRLGVSPGQFASDVLPLLSGVPASGIAGYMTHLISADDIDIGLCERQVASFRSAVKGAPLAPHSIVNSAGLFLDPSWSADLVRPGKALTGINPLPANEANPMQPALSVEAPILQVRTVRRGDSIGYSEAYRATRDMRIATLGIGYANGYLRSLSNRGVVAFSGLRAQLVGRVSMDLVTIDVSDIPEQALASARAEILGPTIDLSELAQLAGTNEYEIQIALGRGCPCDYLNTHAA